MGDNYSGSWGGGAYCMKVQAYMVFVPNANVISSSPPGGYFWCRFWARREATSRVSLTEHQFNRTERYAAICSSLSLRVIGNSSPRIISKISSPLLLLSPSYTSKPHLTLICCSSGKPFVIKFPPSLLIKLRVHKYVERGTSPKVSRSGVNDDVDIIIYIYQVLV